MKQFGKKNEFFKSERNKRAKYHSSKKKQTNSVQSMIEFRIQIKIQK